MCVALRVVHRRVLNAQLALHADVCMCGQRLGRRRELPR
jgi:hypothetical protein